MRRRCAVNALGAFGAAEVGFYHEAFGGGGGPAFVPEQDRQAEIGDIAGKGAA